MIGGIFWYSKANGIVLLSLALSLDSGPDGQHLSVVI